MKSNITLTARLENRDLGNTIHDLQQAFSQKLSLPAGYSVTYGGAYSAQKQSFRELMLILCLATLLVLSVLMFLFREWKISYAILFISLMGICGCLLALWITGIPLNVSSYTGIIMVVGILAENSIFTVHQYRMNRRLGGRISESVDYAIALRIRAEADDSCRSYSRFDAFGTRFGYGGTDATTFGCRCYWRFYSWDYLYCY